ncbi:hypothetical protein RPE78_00470 [Thioclava litoralis]|uniref:Crescentin n=1 Tax=Thioclava litoralis TaxID=3076557 RepID=A0ABZ1E093_9RHOB|nr:hypothetical protein RPE78_00470 [Thioclava sp. FTW29]
MSADLCPDSGMTTGALQRGCDTMTDEAADFSQYERRLAFALARVAKSVETLVNGRDAARADLASMRSQAEAEAEAALPLAPAEAVTLADVDHLKNENKSLTDDLNLAREEVADLQTQVEMAAAEREAALSALEKRLGQRARALTQALSEIERLQAANTDLIAANRGLIDAGGRMAQVQINEALRAEVEALRAARAAERAALDEIIGGIEPLLAARDSVLREEAAGDRPLGDHDEASEEKQDG